MMALASAPSDLERRLRYVFKDPDLVAQALTHRSVRASDPQEPKTYERLEFLGDTVLGFVVAEWLWRDDPVADEGVLTRRRQIVVRSSTLARAATRLGLGSALRLGPSEQASGGETKHSLLADSFEALVGAVFLDGGIRSARAFVIRHLRDELQATRGRQFVPEDAKTRLQERVQARTKSTPVYQLLSSEGPAHQRRFVAAVFVDGKRLGTGRGGTRKHAEQCAARVALARLDGGEST